ncbi:MAG: hypothetical protein ABJB05_01055 [Parafilimonas sp.]
MIKIYVLLLLFFMSIKTASAQSQDDVIYLKNQNIIRGTILTKNDSVCKIQTRDGSIYNYNLNEVENITREKAYKNFIYKKTGFTNYTELGALAAGKTSINGVTTAAFSFQTVNGYKFNQFAMVGAGVGADLYATQTVVPLFLSFRGDIAISGGVIPFYFADAGYGINITQKSAAADNFKGGLLYAAGLGLKIPFNKSAGVMLSLGYRYQKTTYNITNNPTEILYKRLAIRAGFFL